MRIKNKTLLNKGIGSTECTFCHSSNVLPYEEEYKKNQSQTFTIIIISAFILIGSYFLFVLFSYIAYPFMIILLIGISAFVLNRKDKHKPKQKEKRFEKEFICLDCNKSFKQRVNIE